MVEQLGQPPAGMDSWAALLDELIGEMLAHRKIFVMHDRNRSAFEHLHRRASTRPSTRISRTKSGV